MKGNEYSQKLLRWSDVVSEGIWEYQEHGRQGDSELSSSMCCGSSPIFPH